MNQNFQLCLLEAQKIVKEYRSQAPKDFDPQAYVATTTVMIAAMVAALAGAATSAYGMYEQGQTQKKIGEYNATVARNSAVAARQESEAQATAIRSRNMRLQGAQSASASKSGLQLTGSVNDVMFDSSVNGEMDAMMALYKGQRIASGMHDQSVLDEYSGNSQAALSNVGAGATLLTGVGTAAGYWNNYQYANNPLMRRSG